MQVFEVLPHLQRVNLARVTVPRRTLLQLCRGTAAPVWRDIWRLHTGTLFTAAPPPPWRPPLAAEAHPESAAAAQTPRAVAAEVAAMQVADAVVVGAASAGGQEAAAASAAGPRGSGGSVRASDSGGESRCEGTGSPDAGNTGSGSCAAAQEAEAGHLRDEGGARGRVDGIAAAEAGCADDVEGGRLTSGSLPDLVDADEADVTRQRETERGSEEDVMKLPANVELIRL